MSISSGPFPLLRDLALARRTLEEYQPRDEQQAAAREQMLAFVDEHPRDAHLRSCLAGHLTASALLLDARGERALLTHHKKLGRWLQLGGHCDGDANLAGVAQRELVEESGISRIELDPRPIDLDCHRIPARPGEPEHWHLDVRFLARSPSTAEPRVSHESIELAWFSPHELTGIAADESLWRLFRLAFDG